MTYEKRRVDEERVFRTQEIWQSVALPLHEYEIESMCFINPNKKITVE